MAMRRCRNSSKDLFHKMMMMMIMMMPDSRNTPSTTNLEEEGPVDAPGIDGNASMPEQVTRPNPWRKMMMMIMMMPDSRNTPSTTNLEEEETWTPQETMAMPRCWNRSNDLIHGGR